MNYKFGFLALISSFVISSGYITKADFRPPGTVEIVDNFFYDATEISNENWKEYLSFIEVNEGKDCSRYQNALPDTMVWKSEDSYNDPYVQSYFSHQAYGKYPVVGVTQKQAIDFCKWRTGAVKIMLEANDFEGPIDFQYRLPSKTEWELMANAGYGKKQQKLYDKRLVEIRNSQNPNGRVATAHMKYENRATSNPDDLDFLRASVMSMSPAPGRSYLPNKFGVYNIYGNVAEMIAEPGIAMGGSYEHFYDDIVPSNKELSYDGPKKWLGFRCVCEVTQR